MRNLLRREDAAPAQRHRVDTCPGCGHRIETDHECQTHRRCPDEGDVTVCDNCMLIVVRGTDGGLREATAEEAEAAIAAEPEDGWTLSDQLNAIAEVASGEREDGQVDDDQPDDDDDQSPLRIEIVQGGLMIGPFSY